MRHTPGDCRGAVVPPAQRPTPSEKESRTPAQRKINSQLLYELYRLRGEAKQKNVPPDPTGVKIDQKGRALVDVRAEVTPALQKNVRELGGTIESTSIEYRSIIAWVPLDRLERLAAIPPSVRSSRRQQALHEQIEVSPMNFRGPRQGRSAGFGRVPDSGSGACRRARLDVVGFARGRAARSRPDNGIAPEGLAQIEALLREKETRSPAEQKIDSQLLYARRMQQGLPVAPGVQTLEVELPYAADGHVIVDVKANGANVTTELMAQLGGLTGELMKTSPGDLQLHVDLDQIEAIAAQPDVLFVQPRAGGLHVTHRRPSVAGRLKPGAERRAAVVEAVRKALTSDPIHEPRRHRDREPPPRRRTSRTDRPSSAG